MNTDGHVAYPIEFIGNAQIPFNTLLLRNKFSVLFVQTAHQSHQ